MPFSTNQDCLLANEAAIDSCQRFVDTDLNRCFSRSKLRSCDVPDTYEWRRAREINERIGPRFSLAAADVCIDLHNTTSNFGCGIIITDTSSPSLHWKLQLCDYLRRYSAALSICRNFDEAFCRIILCSCMQGQVWSETSLEIGKTPILVALRYSTQGTHLVGLIGWLLWRALFALGGQEWSMALQ